LPWLPQYAGCGGGPHGGVTGFTARSAKAHSWLYGTPPIVLDEGGERCTPNPAALRNMGIFSNFMKNIGEEERWSGRTQSGASWSTEQLRRDLRLQLETVKIEDETVVTLPIGQEISTHAESNVRVAERSGRQSY
jgi:hypothetical protein